MPAERQYHTVLLRGPMVLQHAPVFRAGRDLIEGIEVAKEVLADTFPFGNGLLSQIVRGRWPSEVFAEGNAGMNPLRNKYGVAPIWPLVLKGTYRLRPAVITWFLPGQDC